MKVINDKKRLLFTLKEKTSGPLVVAPEELTLVDESLNQTTPVDSRPYKVYTALLTQSGTDDPIATVLENTLGGPVTWSYESAGDYMATLPYNVNINKMALFNNNPSSSISRIMFTQNDTNTVELATWNTSGTLANLLNMRITVEIRIHE